VGFARPPRGGVAFVEVRLLESPPSHYDFKSFRNGREVKSIVLKRTETKLLLNRNNKQLQA